MKRTIPIILVIAACLTAITSFSQNGSDEKKQKTCKVKVMTTNTDDENSTTVSKIMTVDDNGEKKLVITTTKDGETTVEELVGDEVDKYIEEHGEIMGGSVNGFMMKNNGSVEVEVDVEQLMKDAGVEITEGKNGEKKVIVKASNGSNYSYNYNMSTNEDNAKKVIVKAFSSDGKHSDDNITVLKDKRVYDDVEDIDELLKELGIESDNEEITKDGKKRVIVKKIVVIEDIEETEEGNVKELNEGAANFTAYPNPSNGKFTVEFNNSGKKPANIIVTDTNGKVVHKQKIKGEGEQAAIINLNDAKKGVYFINVTNDEGSSTQKIMVE